jgi:hypothetical protein
MGARPEETMAAEEGNDEKSARSGENAGERRSGERARPPLTIDLTAAEVQPSMREAAARDAAEREGAESRAAATSEAVADGTGAAEAAQDPAGGKEGRRKSSTGQFFGSGAGAFPADEGMRRSLIAGALGAIIALVVLVILQSLGILPSPGRAAAERAMAQAKTATDAEAALERRVAAVETMTDAISGMRQDVKSLTDKVAGLDALRPGLASRSDVDTISANVAGLTKRLDTLPSGDDLKALSQRVGQLESAVAASGDGQGASSAAMTSLTNQINQAQADVRALGDKVAAAEAHPGVTAGDDAVRAVAVAALRRVSADGKPFAADVDMVANLGVGGSDIAIIRPLAAKGVATVADLGAAFPDVADAILAATTATDPNASFLQRAWASVAGLVQVRPLGPVSGSDPAAIVSRMSDDARRGDLAAALAERAALPQVGKDASAEWAAKAADRVALDRAIGHIADASTAKAG